MSDDDLCNGYGKCITLFKDCDRQNNVETSQSTISAAGSEFQKVKSEDDCYIPPAELATLTNKQKAVARAACVSWQKKNVSGKSGGKPKTKGKKIWPKAAKLSTKALQKMFNRKVAAIMTRPKGEDSYGEDEELEINDKKDCHQMRQKLAKKQSGKGN
jgi:hypothetical protein